MVGPLRGGGAPLTKAKKPFFYDLKKWPAPHEKQEKLIKNKLHVMFSAGQQKKVIINFK